MAKSSATRLLSVALAEETDFLLARQRAKQIAEILGFENQDQTRIATAVSEIARNAYEYATGGVVEYYFDPGDQAAFRIVVRDKGKGIGQLDDILAGRYISTSGMGIGIAGSRRLMDDLEIESSVQGTIVTLRKMLPRTVKVPTAKEIGEKLAGIAPQNLRSAATAQSAELFRLLNDLRERERELGQLNQELKETNRGVMVLYSELEDRAIELQQASEMKTRFISGVTHELRTPLNSIVSLTGLLMRRVDGELTPEQEKQVQFIQRSAQNLTEMVNDLLDLAKIEAGKVTVRLSEFSIEEFFAALRGMFRPLATNENVQLIIEEGSVLSTRLYTDEGKLAQILRNFISNALKFTERGMVRVSATLTEGNGVRFAVMDTGVGIAPENLEMIWQEWGQIESDQRAKHKGSGLGLPLARQLATLLGGNTWLESKLNEGSTFFVEIPTAVAPSREAKLAARPEHVILVVDEDEVARYILRRNLFSFTSCVLMEASTLAEARTALAEAMPRVLFLDTNLPDGSGIAFMDELRRAPATADLPIVLLTSASLKPDELEATERHHILHINKNYGDADDQRVALERALLNLGLSDLHTEGVA